MTLLDYFLILAALCFVGGCAAAWYYRADEVRMTHFGTLSAAGGVALVALLIYGGVASDGDGCSDYVPADEAIRLLAENHPEDAVLASIPVKNRDVLWIRDPAGVHHLYVAFGGTLVHLDRLGSLAGWERRDDYYSLLFREALLLRFPQAQRKLKRVEAQHGTAFWVSGKPYPTYVWLKHPVCPSDAGTVVPGPSRCASTRKSAGAGHA